MRPIRSSPDVTLTELSLAFSSVMKRVNAFEHHQIKREKQSTQERMSQLIEHLSDGRIFEFSELFQAKEGKTGALVTFLALLELNKEQRIELSQDQLLAPIYVRKKAQSHG